MSKKRKRVVLAGETEPEPEPEEEIKPPRVGKSTDEMAERLPPPERVRYETTKRILNRFMTEYRYDESQSIKFVDNIMKKYPFDIEEEQKLIHEEKEKYEAMDATLRPTPSPSPPAPPPPAPAPTQSPSPAPPTDASPQLTQAFNDLIDTLDGLPPDDILELQSEDPDSVPNPFEGASLKTKRSKKRKKRKTKHRKTKRRKTKRRKTKRKKRNYH
jgi:hypothetical protein